MADNTAVNRQRGVMRSRPHQYRGIVEWFDATRGFGFVEGDDGQRVFLGRRMLEKYGIGMPQAGDVIEFAVESGARGLYAVDIQLVSAAPASGEWPCQPHLPSRRP